MNHIEQHEGTSRSRLAFALLVAALGLALSVPASTFAAFTRPFLRHTTGTPGEAFSEPAGVATDGEDNLWVADQGVSPTRLDAFDPSGGFLKTVELKENLTLADSLAIERSTGRFYVIGGQTRDAFAPYLEVFDSAGNLVKRLGRFSHGVPGDPSVAVDNSTDPLEDPSACSLSGCSVYIAHGGPNPGPGEGGDGLPAGIEKRNSAGEPVAFTGSASYIKGNEITGTPAESFATKFGGAVRGAAVDAHGNIYAIVAGASGAPDEVAEFSPSGLFVGAFTGGETPGLGGSREDGGFGGKPAEVAVDSVSGHLLVSVFAFQRDEGAVDEFDATGHFVKQIVETSNGARLRGARQLTTSSLGDLYVVDDPSINTSERAVDAWGPGRFLPSVRLAEASERRPASARLSGSVNPEGLALSDCHFEYVSEAAFQRTGFTDLSSGGTAACAPPAGSIPVDNSYHAVEVQLTGLVSGTTYRYRLLATSSGGLGGTAESEPLAFTAPHAAMIVSTGASNISSSFADLAAQVRPLGSETSYRFEYVDEAHYAAGAEDPYAAGASVPASGEVDVGSGGPTGGAVASVVQHIGGLTPGTAYRFRLLASNAFGGDELDGRFATVPRAGVGLPDGRAYELVTPANKGSAADMFGAVQSERNRFESNDFGFASESGDAFLLETLSAFGSFAASGHNDYVFSRTGAGWRTTPLPVPSLGVQNVFAEVFDAGLSRVGVTDQVGSEAAEAGTRGLTLVGPPGGPYTQLSDTGARDLTSVVGGSLDLAHIVLESLNHALAPGAEGQDPGTRSLYESAGGELTLVNVDSEGELLNRCGAVLGQNTTAGARNGAVSADGAKVFFTAPDPRGPAGSRGCWNRSTGENAPQLYMRSGGLTVQVSGPSPGVTENGHAPTQHPAIYVGASEDGSRVFFLSESELTQDAADLKLHDPELYEYETSTGRLTRISAGEPDSPAAKPGSSGAHAFTVPAVAVSGAAVYFTARGQLTSDAPVPAGNEVNLFRYDTTTGRTRYVTTVNEEDYPTSSTANWWAQTGVQMPVEVSLEPQANWYTTPDGRYLLFATGHEIPSIGYRTVETGAAFCPVMNSGGSSPDGHCAEVYRYDARAADSHEPPLVCVSCDASGAPPVANAFFGHSAGLRTAAAGPVPAISSDGRYVFFDTADPLVSQDTNGTLDVYEWHDGVVSLISSGHDPNPSYFLGASADGSNVFFGTHARLVPQDTDTAGDVYDARICTEASPCVKPPASGTGVCEGDACQNPPAAPVDRTPGSLSFSGAGNLVSPSPGKPGVKTLTRLEKLANALKACRKKPRSKRRACEKQARRAFGSAHKANKSRRTAR